MRNIITILMVLISPTMVAPTSADQLPPVFKTEVKVEVIKKYGFIS